MSRSACVLQASRRVLRAYAQLSQRDVRGRLSEAEAQEIKAEVDHYEKVRQEIKLASGDYIDLKMYEPAMRHLLDTYIRAEESEQLSGFDDMTLVELIVEARRKSSRGATRRHPQEPRSGGRDD